MSAYSEKDQQDMQGFIDCFRRDPRRLQRLFLSDADKSCLVK